MQFQSNSFFFFCGDINKLTLKSFGKAKKETKISQIKTTPNKNEVGELILLDFKYYKVTVIKKTWW